MYVWIVCFCTKLSRGDSKGNFLWVETNSKKLDYFSFYNNLLEWYYKFYLMIGEESVSAFLEYCISF